MSLTTDRFYEHSWTRTLECRWWAFRKARPTKIPCHIAHRVSRNSAANSTRAEGHSAFIEPGEAKKYVSVPDKRTASEGSDSRKSRDITRTHVATSTLVCWSSSQKFWAGGVNFCMLQKKRWSSCKSIRDNTLGEALVRFLRIPRCTLGVSSERLRGTNGCKRVVDWWRQLPSLRSE